MSEHEVGAGGGNDLLTRSAEIVGSTIGTAARVAAETAHAATETAAGVAEAAGSAVSSATAAVAERTAAPRRAARRTMKRAVKRVRRTAKVAALALLGSVNWTVKWFRPGGGKSAREIGREIAGLMIQGLMAPEEREA